jgi:hypothetical protein
MTFFNFVVLKQTVEQKDAKLVVKNIPFTERLSSICYK